MKRLIDADALIEVCEKSPGFNPFALAHLNYIVEGQATVDPIQHGYWKKIKYPGKDLRGYVVCSVCDGISSVKSNFCQDCGAKMDAKLPVKAKWRLHNGEWTCSECGNKTDWPLKICNVCASEMEIEL